MNISPLLCIDSSSATQYEGALSSEGINILNQNIIKISKLRVSQDLDKFIQNIDGDTYIVDTGDRFRINVYGPVNDELTLVINPDGKILMPDFGEIYASGLTYNQFKQKIVNFLSKFYSKCKYSVNLVGARTIKINVTGEVAKPGAYMVNPFYTVIDALGEAGGLNQGASMFNICLRSAGKEKKINIYKTVFLGEKQDAYCFRANDIVFVPPIQKVVKIRGAVNRPGTYEITGNDTLEDIINTGGGFTVNSIPEGIFVEREINNGFDKKIIRIDPKEKRSSFALYTGDVVVVPTKEVYQKFIMIAGEFKNPEVSSKLIAMLNQKAEERGYIKKWAYRISQGETVLDVVNACGGVTERANLKFAQVNRTDEKGKKKTIGVNLHKLLYDNDLSQNIELFPGDSFGIPPVLDNVYVVGELRNAGSFPYVPGTTLKEYLVIAGGPLPYANLGNIKIIRGDPDKPEVHTVSMSNMFYGKKASFIRIFPEDIIYVPRTQVVSILDVFGIIQSVVNIYALKKIFE